MNNEKVITLQLKVHRMHVLAALAAFFLCWHPKPLGSETLTLTTYYPAPYGGYANLLTTGQTLMARDSGNVGIGMTNPTVKLQVNVNSGGEIARFGAASSGNSLVRVDAGTAQAMLFATRNANGSVGSYSNNDFYLRTNNVERVRVDTSGRVGIGSSPGSWTPADTLHVRSGNTRIESGNLILSGGNGSTTGFIQGVCSQASFSGGTTYCPSGFERIVAVYGSSCQTAGSMLVNGTDMHIASNWIPHYEPNCSGTMLCCNIRNY